MTALQRSLLTTMLLLAGCAAPGPGPSAPPLAGWVESGGQRHVAATLTEVATGATVSIIDPATGNTLNTTLTDPDGHFILNFLGGAFKPAVGPYFLEAVKGLSMGGSPNRAGAGLIRVRTLVSLQNGSWQTLTGDSLQIGRSTTAVCILSNLKALDASQNLALLNRLLLGAPSSGEGISSPDSFNGTSTLSSTEYLRAFDLVDRAIIQNLDPVAALYKRPAGSSTITLQPGYSTRPELGLSLDGWLCSSVSPTNGPANTLVTVYGQGFATSPADMGVTLNGQVCTVTEASADGSYFRFRVPGGVPTGTYPLVITYGPWSYSALTFTLTL